MRSFASLTNTEEGAGYASLVADIATIAASTPDLTLAGHGAPTAAIVGKLFGVRYLSTLFGLTLLSHQVGGFLRAWLGGLAITRYGDFQWMWYADMALAAAAVVNLPIREAPLRPAAALA